MARIFRSFSYKDTNLKVACNRFDDVVSEIVFRRKQLEAYIRRHAAFQDALSPVSLQNDPPEIAVRMAAASEKTGLGPMASVAGILAQYGVEKALALGETEAIVENGGDMYLAITEPLIIGIHTVDEKFKDNLAFQVDASQLAICSSSSVMGHSHSFGKCGLATVVAPDAALADSAATLLGNLILSVNDIQHTVERVGQISGVAGVMAVHEGRIGLFGELPTLVKNADAETSFKVTRDRCSMT